MLFKAEASDHKRVSVPPIVHAQWSWNSLDSFNLNGHNSAFVCSAILDTRMAEAHRCSDYDGACGIASSGPWTQGAYANNKDYHN